MTETKSRKKRYVERPDLREKLLDGAEAIVREEGYAAATARRIAERVGLKHQAIFYYFGTLDELMLELYRREVENYRKRLTKALDADEPLRAMWDLISDPQTAKFALEFIAMANHNDAIRMEIAKQAGKIRKLEVEGIERHLKARGIEPLLSPQIVSILSNAVARYLVQEATLGIKTGHKEIEELIDESFAHFASSDDNTIEVEPLVGALSPPKSK